MGQLTFKSLCNRLQDKPTFADHVDNLNILIGAIACLTAGPAVGGAAALFTALADKEKLIELGKKAVNAIFNQNIKDYSGRVEQMEEAYGILYFTAFFDELDCRLPDYIRNSIALSQREKQGIFESSVRLENTALPDRREIVFPNIVNGYTMVDAELDTLYSFMAGRVQDFVEDLSFQETASEKDIQTFKKVIEELPSAAIRRFHNQYLTLCSKFNEFYIFTQIERGEEQELKWESRYQEILSAAMYARDSAEAGLAGLKTFIEDIPNQIKKEKVQEIAEELIRKYHDSINQPLIDTKDSEENLTYPLIRDAFIPQSYKLLRYSGEERLERKETWADIEPEQDMESFWAKYCLDPGSVDNLLLILGEPGGGKSLLTTILCARMIAPDSICIRIPLREHNVEDEIETIVCKQIAKDGDATELIQTFKWFAEEFQSNPITLLFDGYDEVMQATGGIYRNLLTKIQRFQNQCREQRRPVRIVVTSRETLIDKADIPKNTTVMKLLEFDKSRKKQWMDIWNKHNHEVLSEARIQDFSLPEGNKDIDTLSGQPLLLLMLAIYDADFESKTNALKQEDGQAGSLDRTRLYDELLRRFIRRELRKGPRGKEYSYEEAEQNEKDAMVDEEMGKLGVSALGMFVREKLSLKVGELEDDLVYMGAKTVDYGSKNKKMLKDAEAVFGSFFFIHDSRREDEEDNKEAAFEFLHKTFYEFLAADLILQYLIDAMEKISRQKFSTRRGDGDYRDALGNPSFLGDAYYAALNSACLCAEPEIIQMISEWKDSKLNQYFQGGSQDFGGEMAQVLDDLLESHAAIIRTGIFKPFADRRSGLAGGRDYLQACAVYIMNLIILKILTGGECRIESGKWEYISQFLKLNVPPPKKQSAESTGEKPNRRLKISSYEEMILKFMNLFQLQQEDGDVVLTKRTLVCTLERETLQEARKSVFDFLQDSVTWKIYRLHDADISLKQKQQYRSELCAQMGNIGIGFEMVLAQLHEYLLDIGICNLEYTINIGAKLLQLRYEDESLVLDWLLCLRLLVSQQKERYTSQNVDVNVLKELSSVIVCHYMHSKTIVFAFEEIVKELGYGDIFRSDLRSSESTRCSRYFRSDWATTLVKETPFNIKSNHFNIF